jgi:hypothetical protein
MHGFGLAVQAARRQPKKWLQSQISYARADRHCEEPATKLRSNFALERRSNPFFLLVQRWIASLRSQ